MMKRLMQVDAFARLPLAFIPISKAQKTSIHNVMIQLQWQIWHSKRPQRAPFNAITDRQLLFPCCSNQPAQQRRGTNPFNRAAQVRQGHASLLSIDQHRQLCQSEYQDTLTTFSI